MAEHRGFSARTGVKLNCPMFSSVRDHCNKTGHACNEDNFEIVATARTEWDLGIYEGLLIARDKPSLNTVEQTGGLRLFR